MNCAVPRKTFGERIQNHIVVGDWVKNIIQEHFWPTYDQSKKVCPGYIFKNCKTYIYKLNRGETVPSTWLQQVTQVNTPIICISKHMKFGKKIIDFESEKFVINRYTRVIHFIYIRRNLNNFMSTCALLSYYNPKKFFAL